MAANLSRLLLLVFPPQGPGAGGVPHSSSAAPSWTSCPPEPPPEQQQEEAIRYLLNITQLYLAGNMRTAAQREAAAADEGTGEWMQRQLGMVEATLRSWDGDWLGETLDAVKEAHANFVREDIQVFLDMVC